MFWTILWIILTIVVVAMLVACIRQICCTVETNTRVTVVPTPAPAPAPAAGNWSNQGGVTIYPAPPTYYTTGGIYQATPVNYAIGTNYVTGPYPAGTSPYPNVIQGNQSSMPNAPAYTTEVHGSHNYPPPPKY